MDNWNYAADVIDGAPGFEIAHHVDEIIGGIKSVFLNRFERGDAFLVETKRVIRLAEMNVELERVEWRREFLAKIAMRLRHHELVDARQHYILIVIPIKFDIGF